MQNKSRFEKLRVKAQNMKNFVYVRHERFPELDLGLHEEEFLYQLAKINPTNLFLGKFSKNDVENTLKETGLWNLLIEKGFRNLILHIDASNVLEHRLIIYDGEINSDRLLIEVRLREALLRPKKCFVPGMEHIRDVPMILIDWLTLQDPTKDFTPDKPRLVHQRKPGLGIFYDFAGLVDLLAKAAGKEGVMDIPEHYHGALFYSRFFHFWEPDMEGKLRAMMRDFASLPLHKATWAVFLDCCINSNTGKVDKWQPGEQIKPVSDQIKAYFRHPEYEEQVDRATRSFRFHIDESKLEKALAEYTDTI